MGQRFTLVTDNRAVQLIINNTSSRPPARIERWALRLSQFDFDIKHRPGISNEADYLSRHPMTGVMAGDSMDRKNTSKYINMIVDSAVPMCLTRKEILEATEKDSELQELKKYIASSVSGRLPTSLVSYCHVINEVNEGNGVLLRGQRIIVPKSLRNLVVDLAHIGHQGIVKTKVLIRSRVRFPGIDRKVQECKSCQANATKQNFEMPDGPRATFSDHQD